MNIPNGDYHTPITKEDQKLTEFAGNASIVYNDLSNIPLLLQLNADFHWLADTDATFHMILH